MLSSSGSADSPRRNVSVEARQSSVDLEIRADLTLRADITHTSLFSQSIGDTVDQTVAEAGQLASRAASEPASPPGKFSPLLMFSVYVF